MVAERIVSKEEQARLCELAKAGDRQAADRLALAVWPWVRRKAGQYGRRYRVDVDDLEAVGLGRFTFAVRYYDPQCGGFVNYMANCAARAMMAHVRLTAAQMEREEGASPQFLDAQPAREAAVADSPTDERVRASLSGLEPKARALVELVEGVNGKPISLKAACRQLQIPHRKAARMYARAFNRLSDELLPAVA